MSASLYCKSLDNKQSKESKESKPLDFAQSMVQQSLNNAVVFGWNENFSELLNLSFTDETGKKRPTFFRIVNGVKKKVVDSDIDKEIYDISDNVLTSKFPKYTVEVFTPKYQEVGAGYTFVKKFDERF